MGSKAGELCRHVCVSLALIELGLVEEAIITK